MNCPKCNRPMHKFHDCHLNPVAVPDMAEIQALAELAAKEIEAYFDNTGGDLAAALDRINEIVELCRKN